MCNLLHDIFAELGLVMVTNGEASPNGAVEIDRKEEDTKFIM